MSSQGYNQSVLVIDCLRHTTFTYSNSRYARAYAGIQFFDPNLFLPPPFTFLSMLVLLVQYIDEYRKTTSREKSNDNGELKGGRDLGLEDRNGGNIQIPFRSKFLEVIPDQK